MFWLTAPIKNTFSRLADQQQITVSTGMRELHEFFRRQRRSEPVWVWLALFAGLLVCLAAIAVRVI
jgi:hypothetical protein